MSSAFSAHQALHQQLAELDASALTRRRRVQSRPCGPATFSDGQPLLAFASNDYLGLANAPELIAAAQEAAARWGVGSGASALVSGHTEAHETLDHALARFVGCEAALGFSTGYLANLAVMPALLGRGDAIFADRLGAMGGPGRSQCRCPAVSVCVAGAHAALGCRAR